MSTSYNRKEVTDMMWLLMSLIVWLFELFVFVVVMSLLIEVTMPGEIEVLHNIYKVILGFDKDES